MVVREEPDADRVFAALADATRRDIVRRAMRGEQSVSQLAAHYEMSFAAVQKHVAVLARAALVTKERRGRQQIVRVEMSGIRSARGLLDTYERLWRGRASRIADVLADADLTTDDGTGTGSTRERKRR